MAADVTTALSAYSPIFAATGAVTRKRAEIASSSFSNAIGALAGVTFQPAGAVSATVACAAPFVPLVTETKISRSTGFAVGALASGTIARAGVTRTENAGTTLSSIRLSPK